MGKIKIDGAEGVGQKNFLFVCGIESVFVRPFDSFHCSNYIWSHLKRQMKNDKLRKGVSLSYKKHYPVLKKECTDFLFSNSKTNETLYISDLTFGGGGHCLEFLKHGDNIQIKACDRDLQAVHFGKEMIRQKKLADKIELVHGNFKDFPQYVKNHYCQIADIGFHGILLDLGVSSHQLESAQRGFSFKLEGPLDMRMDRDNTVKTAEEIVNEYSAEKLKEIFYRLGEESNGGRICRKNRPNTQGKKNQNLWAIRGLDFPLLSQTIPAWKNSSRHQVFSSTQDLYQRRVVPFVRDHPSVNPSFKKRRAIVSYKFSFLGGQDCQKGLQGFIRQFPGKNHHQKTHFAGRRGNPREFPQQKC